MDQELSKEMRRARVMGEMKAAKPYPSIQSWVESDVIKTEQRLESLKSALKIFESDYQGSVADAIETLDALGYLR